MDHPSSAAQAVSVVSVLYLYTSLNKITHKVKTNILIVLSDDDDDC